MRSKAEPPTVGSGSPRGLDPLVAVIVCFGAVFVLSQFFRASNAVIAKTLSAEFGLSPEALGLLTGMFFFAFGAAQIPLGIVFDRFGARRTVPVVLTSAIAGSILYGLADGEAMLIAGRVLLGVGCSGVLMGSLFLFGQWAPAASFSTWMGRMIAIGGAGGLLSTSPLAAIAETLGWRVAFWGAAGLTAAGAIAIYALARDRPSSERGGAIPAEGLRESLSGVRAALATPGFPTLTLMGFASYPVVITVLGLWGGPFLADRHGLGPIDAGNALLVMAVALIVTNLVLGPIERRLDTRKGIILGCAAPVAGALAALAALPDLPTWAVVLLLAVIGACGSYNILLAGHARSLLPDRLAGRGMALMAIAFMGGPAVLQALGGVIVGAFPATDGVAPAIAYQALFAFLAALVALACLAYLRIPDAKPSAGLCHGRRAPRGRASRAGRVVIQLAQRTSSMTAASASKELRPSWRQRAGDQPSRGSGAFAHVLEGHFQGHGEAAVGLRHMIGADAEIGLAGRRRRIAVLGLEIRVRCHERRLKMRELLRQRVGVGRDSLGPGDEVVGQGLVAVDIETEIDASPRHLRAHQEYLRALLHAGRGPGAVKVDARRVGPEMPAAAAVGVHVGHHEEPRLLEQRAGERDRRGPAAAPESPPSTIRPWSRRDAGAR